MFIQYYIVDFFAIAAFLQIFFAVAAFLQHHYVPLNTHSTNKENSMYIEYFLIAVIGFMVFVVYNGWKKNKSFDVNQDGKVDAKDISASADEVVKKVAPKKKTAAKKATVKKADLAKLTKNQLEEFALKNYKVNVDKRKKKADLVDEIVKLSKK